MIHTFESLPVFTPVARRGHTMRESLDAGKYYHVRIPGWASGGWDAHANSPAEAALMIGAAFKQWGWTDCPPITEVLKHFPTSQIGCAYMESCGEFPTATFDQYDI